MTENVILQLIGGLGFFFLGMKTMSEGLKNLAGGRLRKILHLVTRIPLVGAVAGAAVTCLMQSSSATTIMVVGLVNAGLLTIKQAVSVVMGASVGTTSTAWLIASMPFFDVTVWALPAVGLGYAVMSLSRTKGRQSLGQALLGCALVFIGLHFMTEALIPLKESEPIRQMFTACRGNPLIGVAAGVLLSVLLQSPGAAVTVIQVLAFNGVVDFASSLPIILGTNIGTTLTAQMASIGTNLNARRVVAAYTFFHITGVAYLIVLVHNGLFATFIHLILPGPVTATNIMFLIAVAYTLFNAVNVLVFLPFLNFLVKASIRLIPQKEESIYFGTQYLEYHLLDTPALAMEQIKSEILYMMSVCKKTFAEAVAAFFEGDHKGTGKVQEYKDVVDNLQAEITQYIMELSQKRLSPEESDELPHLIHRVNDLGRVADHARGLADWAFKKNEDRVAMDEAVLKDVKEITREIFLMFEEGPLVLKQAGIHTMQKMVERDQAVARLCETFKQNRVHLLQLKAIDLNAEFVLLEFTDHLRKIAARLAAIGQDAVRS